MTFILNIFVVIKQTDTTPFSATLIIAITAIVATSGERVYKFRTTNVFACQPIQLTTYLSTTTTARITILRCILRYWPSISFLSGFSKMFMIPSAEASFLLVHD